MKEFGLCHLVALFMFLVLACLALADASKPGYHLIKRYDIGGGDGKTEYWDYITFDETSDRLYLSHNTEITVVDASTGHVVGTVSDVKRGHGIALVQDLGRGFVSSGGTNEVVVFDIKTLKVIARIKVGGNPDCIIYDPASGHIFAMNGETNNASVIDPAKDSVLATVPLGGRPEFAVADGKGMIYDNIEDKNEVVALDTHSLTIKSRWPIAPAAGATAMAMDKEHRRLFIGGRNKIFAIMNADNGQIVQTFPIGAGVDANIYEASSGLVFSAMRDGTLYLFHEDTPDKFSRVEIVHTELGARNIAIDPKTHKLFSDTVDFGAAPAPTAAQPNPQPAPVPGTFHLLVYER
jgi:YVTN family beta-propeller protein